MRNGGQILNRYTRLDRRDAGPTSPTSPTRQWDRRPAGREMGLRTLRLLPELADDHSEGLALNQLHGVEVHAAFTTDGVHGHDIRVVQLRGRLRLVVEALQLAGVEGGGEGQHLQGDAPPQ